MSWNAPSSSSGGAGFTHVSPQPPTIYKRPKYSKFTQQELPACKPILTLGWVISTFILVSIVFIPLGVAPLFASRNMVEIVYRYETDCIPPASRSNEDKTCNKNLTVPKHMKQPIYVYYQVDNFYQNHRRYVKSQSDGQLKYVSSEDETQDCKPEDVANGIYSLEFV